MKYKYLINAAEISANKNSYKSYKEELSDLRNEISKFYKHTDFYKDCYFWGKHNDKEEDRKYHEEKAKYFFERNYEMIGCSISLKFSLDCTSRYFYSYKEIEINSIKINNSKSLTSTIKEIDNALKIIQIIETTWKKYFLENLKRICIF